MAARTLVEGLFGVKPDMLNKTLMLKPGFPEAWKYATLETPDLRFDYKQEGNKDIYSIKNSFEDIQQLDLHLPAKKASVKKVLINGVEAEWKMVENAIDRPCIEVLAPATDRSEIEIEWMGSEIEKGSNDAFITTGAELKAGFNEAVLVDVYDPQQAIVIKEKQKDRLVAQVKAETGSQTVFVKLAQGDMQWWEPLTFETGKAVEIKNDRLQLEDTLSFSLKNNSKKTITGSAIINPGKKEGRLKVALAPGEEKTYHYSRLKSLVLGENVVHVEWPEGKVEAQVANWHIQPEVKEWETVDLSGYFNDKVTNIFKNDYLSPRSPYPTPQIPIHGLGDWCSYKAYMEIDDSGLRKLAGNDGEFILNQGLKFKSPGSGSRQ